MSGSNPHGQLDKVMNAMFSEKEIGWKVLDMLDEAGGSLLSEDILFSQVKSVFFNEDRFGRKLYTPETSTSEDLLTATKALWKAFEPGGVRTVEKLYGSYGNEKDFTNELIAQFVGFRSYKSDYNQQASYAISSIQKDVRELKKYARAKRELESGEISAAELDKVFNKYQQDKIKLYKPLLNLYKGAL